MKRQHKFISGKSKKGKIAFDDEKKASPALREKFLIVQKLDDARKEIVRLNLITNPDFRLSPIDFLRPEQPSEKMSTCQNEMLTCRLAHKEAKKIFCLSSPLDSKVNLLGIYTIDRNAFNANLYYFGSQYKNVEQNSF